MLLDQSSRKPKVLVDTYHLKHSFTGIGTYTNQLISAVGSSQGLNAEYLIIGSKRKKEKNHRRSWYKLLFHIRYLLWKQVFLPFLVWYHSADFILCPDFVVPAFKPGFRAFAVIHDTFFWEYKDHYGSVWRKYFTKMVEFGVQRKATIIATSQYTRRKIKKHITSEVPVAVVYQCPKLFDVGEKAHVSRRYFLHVGYFDKRKNLGVLIKAFAKFKRHFPDGDMNLILAGGQAVNNKLDDSDNIQELIRSFKLEEFVQLPGYVSDSELNRLYSEAFAYIFPSYDEGFGIPVLEAMQFDLPIIISDGGSLPEIAGGACLVFDRKSPDDLFLRMVDLMDSGVRKRLIEKGKKRRKIFSQSKFIQSIDQLICDCTNEKR